MRNLRGYLILAAFLAFFFFLLYETGHCQVPVALSPDPHPQFLNSSGGLLANGFLYSYAAGSNTLQNTYTDSTGTVQNPDPIPLDATGAPSNGTTQTGIWLANLSYKFCAYNASMVQQWCTDNVTGYFGLLNMANNWSFQQTFLASITDTLTDNQMVMGANGNDTILDFPPPVSGNVTLHFPNTNDTLVGRATTDTLTNKTLTTPTINGVTMPTPNSPGTYMVLTNGGTNTGTLATLSGNPSVAITTPNGQNTGVIGVVVSPVGGTATIQSSGYSYCVFATTPTAGDYFVPTTSGLGYCKDAGPSYPIGQGQVMGRVLSSTPLIQPFYYPVFLFGTETQPQSRVICASAASNTVNAATTSLQPLITCQLPIGSLNAIGKTLRVTEEVRMNPSVSEFNYVAVSLGPTAALGNAYVPIQATTSSTTATVVTITCTVTTAGASGLLSCVSTNTSGMVNPALSLFFNGFGPFDLTGTLYVGSGCLFSTASVSNVCTGNYLLVEELN